MNLKIAIPTEKGKLCAHFGHCEAFYLATIEEGTIVEEKIIIPPAHEPGLYPAWVSQLGAKIVITGGMGEKAKDLFRKENIQFIVGAQINTPRKLVDDFLSNSLITGDNKCNHEHL